MQFGDYLTDRALYRMNSDATMPLLGASSETEYSEEELPYRIAAIHIDNAVHKRKTETQHLNSADTLPELNNTRLSVRAFYLGHNRWWRRFVWLIIIIQLSLAIWERPSTLRTPIESSRRIRMLAGIEALCIFVYVIDMSAKILTISLRNFVKQMWCSAKLFTVVVMTVDIFIAFVWPGSFRFSRPLRAFILLEKSRTVKSIIWSILHTIPSMAPIFIMQGFLIVIYALFGTVVFKRAVKDYDEFSSLIESMVSMFILTTTENFPDVMLPAYEAHPIYAIFFISFLIVSQLFLLNLVLAVFYDTYSSYIFNSVSEGLSARKESLSKAFEMIKNEDGVVVFPDFEKMMFFVPMDDPSPEKVQFIFHMLDKDHDEYLNLKEFSYLCDIFQFEFITINNKRSSVYRSDAMLKIQNRMRAICESRFYTFVRDGLILLVGLFTAAEVQWCQGRCGEYDFMENVIISIFIVELCFRISAYGPRKFFRSNWNRFDAFIIVVCFVTEVIIVNVTSLDMEYVFLLKTLLLFRIVATMKELNVLISTALQLIPSIGCFFCILMSLFYFYAIIGMEIFWNKIKPDNPDLEPIKYYFINFDSMPHTLVTLYVLMTVNNWNTFMAGAVAATSKWSRLYFMTFYLIVVVIVLSVILAFIIEAFVEQHNLKKSITSGNSSHPLTNAINDGTFIYDDEIRERIEIALKRSRMSNAWGKAWKVIPRRNLDNMWEEMFKKDEDK